MLVYGQVDRVYYEKKAYWIVSRDRSGTAFWARPLDVGVECPYDQGETVLCVSLGSLGHVILGRVPLPQNTPKEDTEKTPEELRAESISQLKGGQGDAPTDVPNYRELDEEPHVPGDVIVRRTDKVRSFMGMYSDGSLVIDSDNILSMLFSAFDGSFNLRAEELNMMVGPGSITLNAVHKDMGQQKIVTHDSMLSSYNAGMTESERENKKLNIKLDIQSDPDGNPDLYLEGGQCSSMKDWKNGKSQRTSGKALENGFKIRLGTFADMEVDLPNKELRLTMAVPLTTASPFQMRMNPDEFVLMRGSQFISFSDKGIFLKGNVIGLDGRLVAWGPGRTSGLAQDMIPETFQNQDLDWMDATETKGYPGFVFKSSVYFGKEGMEQPAVLEPFLQKEFSKIAKDFGSHTHVSPTSGGTTSPPSNGLPWLADALMYSNPAQETMYLDQISKIMV